MIGVLTHSVMLPQLLAKCGGLRFSSQTWTIGFIFIIFLSLTDTSFEKLPIFF